MKGSRLLSLLPAVALLVACGGSDRSGAQAEQGVTVELPPFEPEPVTELSPAGNAAMANEVTELNVLVPAALERELEAPHPAPKPAEPPPSEPKLASKAETPAPKIAVKTSPPPPKASETVPKADTDAPRPAATRLPISNERIAQTIQRIGYACGEVTGTTAVEGQSVPTWRITCSSGDTYRGTNRNGNMRFRKLD